MVSKTDPGKWWIPNYNWKLWLAKQILHNLGRISTTDKVKEPKMKNKSVVNLWFTSRNKQKSQSIRKKGRYCIFPSAASE